MRGLSLVIGVHMVRISKDKVNKLEELIIYILRQRGKPISTKETAETLARSWAYTNKILNEMRRKGIIRRIDYGATHFWALS